jgi:predicted Zn-dependent protease
MEKALIVLLAACAHAQTCPASDPAGLDRCARQLVATTPISPELADRAITDYVSEVGARVVRATGDRRRWRFVVVDEGKLEAHAAVGHIYVTRGLLAALRDEAELAAVLAHQLAHALAGHADEIRAESESSSRDDEAQADALAVGFVARAGYDPRAVLSATRAIAATADDASDPSWDTRLEQIALLVRARPAGELAADRYRARLVGLAVGADPRHASIVGDAIVFGGARVAIDTPPGYSFVGVSDAASMAGDGAVVLIFPVTPAYAPYLPRFHKPGERYEIYSRGGHTLAVNARGDNAAKAMSDVLARFRAARPDELAKLHPTLVDFSAPRLLR